MRIHTITILLKITSFLLNIPTVLLNLMLILVMIGGIFLMSYINEKIKKQVNNVIPGNSLRNCKQLSSTPEHIIYHCDEGVYKLTLLQQTE